MPINLEQALTAPPVVIDVSWIPSDVIFYHLSLGAQAEEVQLTYEKYLQTLPTFGLVAGGGPSKGITRPEAMSLPGVDVDLRKVLHAGQAITVHRDIPVTGQATSTQRIANILDKQKAAIIELETSVVDDNGPLWTQLSRIWVHGEGGFGGTSGPGADEVLVAGGQHNVLTSQTTEQQAALYRLNGDYNPLHIDPEFAQQAGLQQPILHGLATLGIAALDLVRGLCDGDPTRLLHIDANFSNPVTPGQQLQTTVQDTSEHNCYVFTTVNRADNAVLRNGVARVVA